MGKKLDVKIGDKIGTYTIIDIITKPVRKYGKRFFSIRCLCGNEKCVESHQLKSPRCIFCLPKSFEGTRNGRLVFKKYIGKSFYEADCDCGNQCIVRKRSISCGCHLKENVIKKANNLIGLKFNNLKIIGIHDINKSTIYKAKCDCGNLTYVRSGCFNFKKSCGCAQKKNHIKGSLVWASKLTESEVSFIRDVNKEKSYSHKDLCEMFNITLGNLRRILSYKSWKHVK